VAFAISCLAAGLPSCSLTAQEIHRIEAGTRLRLQLAQPTSNGIEGRFWESREDGLLLEYSGRPEFFAWSRIESIQYWSPVSGRRWGELYGAIIGAAVLGYTGGRLSSDQNGEGRTRGLALGIAVGGVLGWAIGHGVSGDEGDWTNIPVADVRGLGEAPR
jgi:hypothetical protein